MKDIPYFFALRNTGGRQEGGGGGGDDKEVEDKEDEKYAWSMHMNVCFLQKETLAVISCLYVTTYISAVHEISPQKDQHHNTEGSNAVKLWQLEAQQELIPDVTHNIQREKP